MALAEASIRQARRNLAALRAPGTLPGPDRSSDAAGEAEPVDMPLSVARLTTDADFAAVEDPEAR